MENNLKGHTALITGGSGGIGKATCLALARSGSSIAVHYNSNKESAEAIVEEISYSGGKAVALQANLNDPGSISQLISESSKLLGPIDILVNNAGRMIDTPLQDISDKEWDLLIDLNLSAPFRLIRGCLPFMYKKGWGRIINICSQAAYTGSKNHSHYAASKSGLLGLTFSLVKELGNSNITVNLVVPGRILTKMVFSRSEGREKEWLNQTPLGRFGNPEEVANTILFLTSEKAAYITGAKINISGGQFMG
jgi:3-oxoacyl-[acyl-carrier protein] reductase